MSGSEPPPGAPAVLSVAALVGAMRAFVEDAFTDVWVEGEVRDARRPSTGHVYFALADTRVSAQIPCVFFRSDAVRSRAKIIDGAKIRVRGRLTVFEPRGTVQLCVRVALPAGAGDRFAEREKLRQKLASEGLLAAERKRALPKFPRAIGVVTSGEGAALHDIVRIAHARCGVRIVIAPCLVQGDQAPASIVRALMRVSRLPDIDVVIVGRGGGSAEDLSPFDDERVARAIAASVVPVVSAVGHETDITIADLVADVRASTPSNAAEIVVPDRAALNREVDAKTRVLRKAIRGHLGQDQLRVAKLSARLPDPHRAWSASRVRHRELLRRLELAADHLVARHRDRADSLVDRVKAANPRTKLNRDRFALATLASRLPPAITKQVDHERGRVATDHALISSALREKIAVHRTQMAERCAALDALSPLSVLARGYAIALDIKRNRAVTRASDVSPGDSLRIRLHEGELHAVVRTSGKDT